MRRSHFIGVMLLCLAVPAYLIFRGRKSADRGGKRAGPPPIEILLVGGLHANETCAPIMAREVARLLGERGERVALFQVPNPYTLLALIDDPEAAVTDYSMPAGQRRLDMDLDGLDEHLERRYPGALVFEFHNSENTLPMLGIDPGKPVRDYEVGTIGPRFERPYEIGTWRNVNRDGRPGKYLIEVPACYAPAAPSVREKRRRRLEQLHADGYEYDPRWLHYLESGADLEATRRRGYLDDILARKVADWITSRRGASR